MFARLTTLLTLALALPSGAGAFEVSEAIRAELRPGWREPDGRYVAALQIELADGWKTYWRAPGEAGIPPSFNWAGSTNLAGVEFRWPSPEVFDLGGIAAIGYKHELTLPMVITPQGDGPVTLDAAVELGICSDICVPVSLRLSGRLDGAGAPDAGIRAALERGPRSAAAAGVGAVRCTVEPLADGLRLSADIAIPAQGKRETVVVEFADRDVWVAPVESRRAGAQLLASAEMYRPDGQPFALNREGVTITILGGDRAVELAGCPAG